MALDSGCPGFKIIVQDRDAAQLHNMGSCQNYGPFLDPYYSRAPNI